MVPQRSGFVSETSSRGQLSSTAPAADSENDVDDVDVGDGDESKSSVDLQHQYEQIKGLSSDMLKQAIEISHRQGNAAYQKRAYKDAIQHFHSAIVGMQAAGDPSRSSDMKYTYDAAYKVYSNRAACYLHFREWRKALNDSEESCRLQPTWSKGYFRSGRAYFQLAVYDKAKACFESALQHIVITSSSAASSPHVIKQRREIEEWLERTENELDQQQKSTIANKERKATREIARLNNDMSRFDGIGDDEEDEDAEQNKRELGEQQRREEEAKFGVPVVDEAEVPAQIQKLMQAGKMGGDDSMTSQPTKDTVQPWSFSGMMKQIYGENGEGGEAGGEHQQSIRGIAAYLERVSELAHPATQLSVAGGPLTAIYMQAVRHAYQKHDSGSWLLLGCGTGLPALTLARLFKRDVDKLGKDAKKPSSDEIYLCTNHLAPFMNDMMQMLLLKNNCFVFAAHDCDVHDVNQRTPKLQHCMCEELALQGSPGREPLPVSDITSSSSSPSSSSSHIQNQEAMIKERRIQLHNVKLLPQRITTALVLDPELLPFDVLSRRALVIMRRARVELSIPDIKVVIPQRLRIYAIGCHITCGSIETQSEDSDDGENGTNQIDISALDSYRWNAAPEQCHLNHPHEASQCRCIAVASSPPSSKKAARGTDDGAIFTFQFDCPLGDLDTCVPLVDRKVMNMNVQCDGTINAIVYWYDTDVDGTSSLSYSNRPTRVLSPSSIIDSHHLAAQQAVQWIEPISVKKNQSLSLLARHNATRVTFEVSAVSILSSSAVYAAPTTTIPFSAALPRYVFSDECESVRIGLMMRAVSSILRKRSSDDDSVVLIDLGGGIGHIPMMLLKNQANAKKRTRKRITKVQIIDARLPRLEQAAKAIAIDNGIDLNGGDVSVSFVHEDVRKVFVREEFEEMEAKRKEGEAKAKAKTEKLRDEAKLSGKADGDDPPVPPEPSKEEVTAMEQRRQAFLEQCISERGDVCLVQCLDPGLLGAGVLPYLHHAWSHLLRSEARIVPYRAGLKAMLVCLGGGTRSGGGVLQPPSRRDLNREDPTSNGQGTCHDGNDDGEKFDCSWWHQYYYRDDYYSIDVDDDVQQNRLLPMSEPFHVFDFDFRRDAILALPRDIGLDGPDSHLLSAQQRQELEMRHRQRQQNKRYTAPDGNVDDAGVHSSDSTSGNAGVVAGKARVIADERVCDVVASRRGVVNAIVFWYDLDIDETRPGEVIYTTAPRHLDADDRSPQQKQKHHHRHHHVRQQAVQPIAGFFVDNSERVPVRVMHQGTKVTFGIEINRFATNNDLIVSSSTGNGTSVNGGGTPALQAFNRRRVMVPPFSRHWCDITQKVQQTTQHLSESVMASEEICRRTWQAATRIANDVGNIRDHVISTDAASNFHLSFYP